ncbi:MAG: hypothetical protein ACHQ03_12080, partial [Candidatus Bathyarchaeia archaeon]
ASNKAPAKTPIAQEPSHLPESTFDLWMKKQKPKDSTPEKSQTAVTPDTFDLWIDKQVAERSSAASEKEEVSVSVSATAE